MRTAVREAFTLVRLKRHAEVQSETGSSGDFYQTTVQVANQAGIHTRPASMFIRMAQSFKSNILVDRDGKDSYERNGKNIIAVMSLAAETGDIIKISAIGPDAFQAVVALETLVASGFGEVY